MQVKNDLRRLYRLRNLLVHQAYVGEVDLSRFTRRLIFYLEVILKNLSYGLDQNPKHNMIELLISKGKTYDLLVKKLKNNTYSDLNIRNIIYPTCILSN